MNHLWLHDKWCATKLFSSIVVNVWLIILTTWNFKMQAKFKLLDYQIVTSCIAMVNVVFLLFIWKEMTWKIPNLENLEFYTCTLWDHNAKFLNYGLQRELMDAKCLHSGRNKWNSVNHLVIVMRNDVLQNYLDQFL